jgi:hypothetical protein
MIAPEFQKILNKLYRIDPSAMEYVKQRYIEDTCFKEAKDQKNTMASLFTWGCTPQNFTYWNTKYNDLPNTTPKGNVL